MIAYLKSETDGKHKYQVQINKPDGSRTSVKFGAKGYSDYTKHKDSDRMKRYLARHRSRENWTRSGINTAGFWSRWILWSKPTLKEAIAYTSKKFNITIQRR
jgi:hypothetical protein